MIPALGLDDEVERLLQSSLAKSTTETYRRCWREYVEFCEGMSVPFAGPTSSSSVVSWVASMSKRGLGYGSVMSYLSAVRHMFKRKDIPIVFESARLQLVLRGLKRTTEQNKLKPKRPVTAC
jgi:hypothetical protein